MSNPSPTPRRDPGWYPDDLGVTRFWDGNAWTDHVAPPPPPGQVLPPAPSPGLYQPSPVAMPMPVQPNVKQARDRAQYNRQQTGHSIIKHLFLGWVLAYIPTIYYAISPNHYFHA